MDRVLVKIKDHIAEVILNRADKLNALDIPMFNAIIKAGQKVSADPSVRCVVIRAEGKAFCSGMDVSNFLDPSNTEFTKPLDIRTHNISNKWQMVAWVWRECPVPVIAAAHGVSFGGGLQIMSGADIKYAHPETQFSILEGRWGLIPDMAGTQLWRHNVREDVIKELTYTNRKFTAEEAVQFGFVSHIADDPVQAAFDLAKQIVEKSPSAIVKAKKVLNESRYLNAEDGLMLESKEQEEIIRKHNQVESVFSQMQKRKANFKDFR